MIVIVGGGAGVYHVKFWFLGEQCSLWGGGEGGMGAGGNRVGGVHASATSMALDGCHGVVGGAM